MFNCGKKIALYLANMMTYQNYQNYIQQLFTNSIIDEKSARLLNHALENKESFRPSRVTESVKNFKQSVSKQQITSLKNKDIDVKTPLTNGTQLQFNSWGAQQSMMQQQAFGFANDQNQQQQFYNNNQQQNAFGNNNTGFN